MPSSTCRLFAVVALCVALAAPVRATADEVLVFAASSLKTALDRIVLQFERTSGHQVTVSYAASSVLARQIQLGAPADLFISANIEWMNALEQSGHIQPASRIDLVGNSLVLIGTPDHDAVGQITDEFDLAGRLDAGYLAMGLVDAVPAGVYGKAALENLGLWDGVKDKVAQADNARAALALVATGAAPMGIVYGTDARIEGRVAVVGAFPASAHPPIVYPAALTAHAGPAAAQLLDFLRSDTATVEFLMQGFTLPGG